ncbi:unnamed protein product [Amoebophrya sp. A25]|nr:unnamed protein product [Amoebophrya sp. A25]|eukprot:GSA25T00000613001.1
MEDCFLTICRKIRNREWEAADSLEKAIFINLRSSIGQIAVNEDEGTTTKCTSSSVAEQQSYQDHESSTSTASTATAASTGAAREYVQNNEKITSPIVRQVFQLPGERPEKRKGSSFPAEAPIRLVVDQIAEKPHAYVTQFRVWESLYPNLCTGELFHDLLEDTLWSIGLKPEQGRSLRSGLGPWHATQGRIASRRLKTETKDFPFLHRIGDRRKRLLKGLAVV